MGFKVVFAGTPHFAIPSLEALLINQHVCAVYTKPDSPSGRGLKLTFSPVKQFVVDNRPDLPIFQPDSLKDVDIQKQLSQFNADLMIVIAYGLILPKAVLSLFKYGCLNVHASLLPRWRGAAPIQRALLAGDAKTGVTIMQIDEGLDTGDMLNTKEYSINPRDTAKDVHHHLAHLGAQALQETLEQIQGNYLKPKKQDNKFATYAAKLTKDEARINWHESAGVIDRQIRAFNPWPIAFSHLGGQLLKIWEAQVISMEPTTYLPGQIICANEKGIDVATAQGVIRVLTVQISGGRSMAAQTFLNSRSKLIIPLQTFFG